VAAGIVVLLASAGAVHALFSHAPLWMAGLVALVPALIITHACVSLAERWGLLRALTANREDADNEGVDRTVPRWVSWVGTFVGAGLFVWFGDSWYDQWRHIYPAAPPWMLYVTIVVLLVLGSVVVEIVLDEIVQHARGKAVDTFHDQHRPSANGE
jgi:hypothetical protein